LRLRRRPPAAAAVGAATATAGAAGAAGDPNNPDEGAFSGMIEGEGKTSISSSFLPNGHQLLDLG
jgi:hypothetical protein